MRLMKNRPTSNMGPTDDFEDPGIEKIFRELTGYWEDFSELGGVVRDLNLLGIGAWRVGVPNEGQV